MSDSELVLFEQIDEFAVATLNRPEALNALSFALIEQLDGVITKAVESQARALLITGAGEKSFCAGADIKELRGRGMMDQKAGLERGQQVFARLSTLAIPTVAVLNGYAFGGGLEMAMACNFRIAASTAVMGQPEIRLGLIPGYGGSQRLPRLVGEGRALELIMTGRNVRASEAFDIGLVSRLVDDQDDIMETAFAFAREFSGFSVPVLHLAREAVSRALDTPVGEGLKLEADLATLAFQTEDAEEGMAAFEEKRKPAFRDV